MKIEHRYYTAERVKNALLHFLLGKFFSALAGFLSTIIITRTFLTKEYAAYSIMLGLTLIVGTISSFSLDNTSQRYIPEVKTNGNKIQLIKLIATLLSFRILLLVCIVALLVFSIPWIANYLSLSDWIKELHFLPFVFFSMALFRFITTLLETLLLQISVKWLMWLVMLSRLGLILAFILSLGTITLMQLLWIELSVYGTSLVCGIIMLYYYLNKIPPGNDNDLPSHSPILFKKIFRFSLFNYLRDILWLFSSHGVNRLITGTLLIPFQVAAFGFAQTLATTTQRYVPSTLLKNLIRPVLMARFAEEKNYLELNKSTNLVYKINCFIIAPLIIIFILFGTHLTLFLSDGKYPDASWMFSGLLILLVLEKHHQILEALLNAAEKTQYLFYASLIPVIFFLPAILCTKWIGIAGLLLCRGIGILLRDVTLIYHLSGKGLYYSLDYKGLFRIGLSTVLTITFFSPIISNIKTFWHIIALTILSVIVYLGISLLLKPFSKKERERINSLLPLKLFLW